MLANRFSTIVKSNIMATSKRISLTPSTTGLWNIIQRDEVAEKTSDLLQQDMEVNNPFLHTKMTVLKC